MNENETYFAENIVCQIVHLKDGTYGITLYGDLKVSVDYMQTNTFIIHIASKKVILNVTIEYCSMYGKFTPLISIAFEWVKDFTNNIIHPCPYHPVKHFGIENFPLHRLLNEALDIFPGVIKIDRGEYMGITTVKDRKGRKVFYVKTLTTVSQRRGSKSG